MVMAPSESKVVVKKEQKRRKRDGSDTTSGRRKRQKQSFLNGMVVAVSTLQTEGEAHQDTKAPSYQRVSQSCRRAGATVTGQVHGRVSLVLCSKSACQNLTQRVRKALKKNIPLVDIAWLDRCHAEGERIDPEPYLLDELGKEMLKKTSNSREEKIEEPRATEEDLPEEGWSEPVDLGCCCVCHENGTDQCPWCTNCSVVLANKKIQKEN